MPVGWLAVRLMTSSAPQLAATPGGALALRQLLNLADGLGLVAILIQYVNGDGALEMTLLTDAFSRTGGQFSRIDDIARRRAPDVSLRRAMAALAGDARQNCAGWPSPVAAGEFRCAGVAKETCLGDRTVEIDCRRTGISR